MIYLVSSVSLLLYYSCNFSEVLLREYFGVQIIWYHHLPLYSFHHPSLIPPMTVDLWEKVQFLFSVHCLLCPSLYTISLLLLGFLGHIKTRLYPFYVLCLITAHSSLTSSTFVWHLLIVSCQLLLLSFLSFLLKVVERRAKPIIEWL